MYPNDLFPTLDFLNVNLYGVLIAVGVLLCFVVLFSYAKRMGISTKFTDFLFYNGVVAIAVGFFSAALFQGIYNYIENPSAGFSLTGGITFIGGLIGGVIVFLIGYAIFRNKFDNKLGDVLNFVPCCILIAHAFGRLGCLTAGCCYGGPAEGAFAFLGISFAPGSSAYYEYGATPLHPTQLYEAIFLLATFAVMTYLVFRGKHHGRNNLAIYLIAYGVFRYLNELLRADYRGTFVQLVTPSQFWSILMVVIGVTMLILVRCVPTIAKVLQGKYATTCVQNENTVTEQENAEEVSEN